MSKSVIIMLLAASVESAQVPRVWTQSAIDTLELPLVNAENSPVHVSEDSYYQIPECVLLSSFLIWSVILPAAIQDANPFERQAPNDGLMLFATRTMLVVIGMGPFATCH